MELADRKKLRMVAELKVRIVDLFLEQRESEGASGKTRYTEAVIIRQLALFCLRREMIASDPLAALRLETPKPTPQPCWTREETLRIIASASEPQRSAFTLLAETGMRIGELEHLTWDDVDFEHGFLHIRAKDGWKPKTGDRRAIPISPIASEVLARLPRHARWVLTAAPSAKRPAGDGPISERRLLTSLRRTLRRLGLPGHLHTFRHAFISHALQSNIPTATVRKWVGHVDEATIRLYTHVTDADSRDAMRRLSSATTANASLTNVKPSTELSADRATSSPTSPCEPSARSSIDSPIPSSPPAMPAVPGGDAPSPIGASRSSAVANAPGQSNSSSHQPARRRGAEKPRAVRKAQQHGNQHTRGRVM